MKVLPALLLNGIALSSAFTPGASFLGGLMIGAASSINLLAHGRITGISGIVNGVFVQRKDRAWRYSFLSGFLCGGITLSQIAPHTFGSGPPSLSLATVVASGILVGYGTQKGSGCTSGHGVCGIPRRSIRSVVAVGAFCASGAITATLTRNVDWIHNLITAENSITTLTLPYSVPALTCTALTLGLVSLLRMKYESAESLKSILASYGTGAIFSVGLGISGMCDPQKVLSFLDPLNTWDPSLAFVMGGAVLLNLVAFPLILRRKEPMLLKQWSLPNRKDLTNDLVIGSALFGIGWGLGGVCPGPGLLGTASGMSYFWIWNLGMVTGMSLFNAMDRWKK